MELPPDRPNNMLTPHRALCEALGMKCKNCGQADGLHEKWCYITVDAEKAAQTKRQAQIEGRFGLLSGVLSVSLIITISILYQNRSSFVCKKLGERKSRARLISRGA